MISEPFVQSIILGSTCYALTPGGMLIPQGVAGMNDKLMHAILLGGATYIFTQYVRPSGWYTGMWYGEKRTVNNKGAPSTDVANSGSKIETDPNDFQLI